MQIDFKHTHFVYLLQNTITSWLKSQADSIDFKHELCKKQYYVIKYTYEIYYECIYFKLGSEFVFKIKVVNTKLVTKILWHRKFLSKECFDL